MVGHLITNVMLVTLQVLCSLVLPLKGDMTVNRDISEPFLMTPYSLLRMPEYIKLFDSTQLGSMFRFLTTGILRREPEDFNYTPSAHVCKQAELYKDGHLVAYFTDDDLSDALSLTTRRISTIRATLEELKIVKTERFSGGLLYYLGERFMMLHPNGYSVGGEAEALYIDSWTTMVKKDEVKFRQYLVDTLAPAGGSNGKTRSVLLGKIFQDNRKNISRNTPPGIVKKLRTTGAKEEIPSHETFTNEDSNEDKKENYVKVAKVSKESLLVLYERIKAIYDRCKHDNFRSMYKLTKALEKELPKLLARQTDIDVWLSNFEKAVTYAAKSEFHQGKNDRGWTANIDYFLREDGDRVYSVISQLEARVRAEKSFSPARKVDQPHTSNEPSRYDFSDEELDEINRLKIEAEEDFKRLSRELSGHKSTTERA